MKPLTDVQLRVLKEAKVGDVWRGSSGYVTRRGEQSYVVGQCIDKGLLWTLSAPQRRDGGQLIEITFRGHAALQEARG